MLRRRLSITAIVSSCAIATGLFLLDVSSPSTPDVAGPSAQSKAALILEGQEDRSVAPEVSVGTKAEASLQASAGDETNDIPQSSEPILHTLEVGKGDTLMELLVRNGVDRNDAFNAIQAMSDHYDPRSIRPGQEIDVIFQEAAENQDELLQEIRISTAFNQDVSVQRIDDSNFKAEIQTQELVTSLQHSTGEISSSLYLTATQSGVPANILMELVRAYSWDVDFQRDIQPGDKFEVMYERLSTPDGSRAKFGKVRYAKLTLSGQDYPVYLYRNSDGIEGFYNDKGFGAQKALMRTPINGARLSSGYGQRRHPVLGYTKMHRGVDFAAAQGTPIYAAGDGVIDYIGRNGSYGNYIRIRHNEMYKTAYAHMRGFRSGLKNGTRVRQGQVIGYVGTTGRSTGPHLHFEILKGDHQVNPMKVRMPSGKKLETAELKRFMSVKAQYDQQLAALLPQQEVASIAR